MNSELYIKIGRLTAIISFLFGTIIFVLYYQTSTFKILFYGLAFIALTGLINIGILISILLKAHKDKDNKKKLMTTSGIMLLNIPVMLIYCWFATVLLNTMRITFINSTETILTNINIVGCGDGQINKLEVGQSETVWCDISGDCSISINYLSNGLRKEEIVAGYLSNNSGQKMQYNIGGQNKEQF